MNHQKVENRKVINKLLFVSVFCCIFMTAEIIGGYISNSLAIMTDAAHLLSDLLGFIISICALLIGQYAPTSHLSYGYHRAEIIGALTSVILIWGLTAWLIYAAIWRLILKPDVDGGIMLITAFVGLACNLIMMNMLHERPEGAGKIGGHGHSHDGAGHGGHGAHGGGQGGHGGHGSGLPH